MCRSRCRGKEIMVFSSFGYSSHRTADVTTLDYLRALCTPSYIYIYMIGPIYGYHIPNVTTLLCRAQCGMSVVGCRRKYNARI
jgi:hypothetical protein